MWDASDGWIMGPNNVYVKMPQYNPNSTTAPSTTTAPTQPTSPSPSNSLLRPIGFPDQKVGQTCSPIVEGVAQQQAPPRDILKILLNGEAAFQSSMDSFGGLSTQQNPLAALQAQYDAEDDETRKRYEQEALQAQQQISNQAAQANHQTEVQF